MHGHDIETRLFDTDEGDYGPAPDVIEHEELTPPEAVNPLGVGVALNPPRQHTYRRIEPKYLLRAEGKPDRMFQQVAYIHTGTAERPPMERQVALADALATWWFTELGADVTDVAESNGHKGAPGELAELPAPVAQFHAACDCGDECHMFTLLERATWMRSHLDQGHKPKTYEPSHVDSEEK